MFLYFFLCDFCVKKVFYNDEIFTTKRKKQQPDNDDAESDDGPNFHALLFSFIHSTAPKVNLHFLILYKK